MENQLKAGAILNYVVLFLNTLVNLLYTPYMLRMMGQSEYGLYSLVASVIAYLTLLDLGLGNAVVRYTAKFRAEEDNEGQYRMLGMFFVLYVILGILVLFAGYLLYLNVDPLFGDTMTPIELNRARVMVLILIFNLSFSFPMSIFGSVIVAYERFVFPQVINIIRISLNTVLMIILLNFGYKAIAMVIVQTAFNVLTLVINYLYCKHYLHIKMFFGHFKWGQLKEVAIYSFWIFLNIVMDKIYWSSGQFILGAMVGTVAVSVFAVAIHLESMYLQFSTAISSVFLPKVTCMVTKNEDAKHVSDLFIKTGRLQNIVMSLILFGFIIFGRQFIRLWAGVEYSGAYPITVLFFVALYIPLIQNMGITILQARNQMMFRSIIYILIALCALVAEIVFSKKYGGMGCAVAIASALLLGQGLIMNIYYSNVQKIDIRRFWKEILKMDSVPFCVSLCFYLFLTKFVNCETWCTLVVSVAIYCLCLFPIYYLFSLNQFEREMLVKTVIRKIFYDKNN